MICQPQDLVYTENDDGVVITGRRNGFNPTGKMVIPETIDDEPVLAIEGSTSRSLHGFHFIGAFQGCEDLTEVVLPPTVQQIRMGAFRQCKNLSKVEFPCGVKTIDEYAFAQCDAITDIVLPYGLVRLGRNVFTSCTALKTVTLPKTLQIMGSEVFWGCESLKWINLKSQRVLGYVDREIGYCCAVYFCMNMSEFDGEIQESYQEYLKENIDFFIETAQKQKRIADLSMFLTYKNRYLGFLSLLDEL